MSWYTFVYPTEGFNLDEPKEKVEERINKKKEELDELWAYINGLCVASPNTLNTDDPIKYVTKAMTDNINKYIELSNLQNHDYHTLRMIEERDDWGKYSTEEEDTEYKPHIWYNRFQHTHDPENGIDEYKHNIEYIKKRLINYACSSPKDIIINDPNSDEVIQDVVLYLTKELDELREWLDEELYDLSFCELLLKYYDTYEEG